MPRYLLLTLLALGLSTGAYFLFRKADGRGEREALVRVPLHEDRIEGVARQDSLRVPLDLPPPVQVESSEPSPGTVDAKAESETLQLSRELLEELRAMQEDGSLSTLSVPRLEELEARIRRAYESRCQEIFDSRMTLGLFETRRVSGTISMTALEKEYGCKLGGSVGQAGPDGYALETIVLYPEAEYPEIYELDRYLRSVVLLSRGKRKNP